jgi:hypothetical protein
MFSKDLVLIMSLIRRKKETISETLCGVCSDNGRHPNYIGNGINTKPLSKIFLFQQNFVLAHIIYLCAANDSELIIFRHNNKHLIEIQCVFSEV